MSTWKYSLCKFLNNTLFGLQFSSSSEINTCLQIEPMEKVTRTRGRSFLTDVDKFLNSVLPFIFKK